MEAAEKLLQEKIDLMKTALKAESKEALDDAIKGIKDLADAEIKKLKDQLEAQKKQLTELEIKAEKSKIKSYSKIVEENTEKLQAFADKLKSKDGSNFKAYLSTKDITDANAIEDAGAVVITRTEGNFGSDWTLAQQPAKERIPKFDLFGGSGVTLIPITGTNAPYVDEITTGDAGVQENEGDPKAQIEVKYVQSVADPKTYAGYTRVSDQMLEDLVMLQAWLFDVLRRKLKVAYNDAFINGTGTAGETDSLTTLSTEIDVTGLEQPEGQQVGIADVINAAITNISINNFDADTVFMNPKDFYKLMSERGSNGQYVDGIARFRDYMIDNPFAVRIWVTTYVPENTLFVNEIGMIKTIYKANKFAMPEMGLNGEDFRENMMSIRAHVRLENVVPQNDRGALIKVSDISATIDLLTTEPAP